MTAMTGIITLLTDFGVSDEYTGVMKGVILSICPSAVIIDITHDIDPQDLKGAAYMIESSYEYFPEGTVHVAVVDPGVGTRRAVLAAGINGHIMLAPDNGILTLVMEQGHVDFIKKVENSDYFLKSISQTFHGRDIFAPVAAHIAKGLDMKKLGPDMDLEGTVRLDIQKPYISKENEIIGNIVSIDHFGNLVTNIDIKFLETFGADYEKRVVTYVDRHKISGLSASYESAGQNSPLVIAGSRGYLEIAVNCGSAADLFNLAGGSLVRCFIV